MKRIDGDVSAWASNKNKRLNKGKSRENAVIAETKQLISVIK